MKYMTSGDIHRMFKQEDEGTIIRRMDELYAFFWGELK